jgi:alkylation response protein AidB-like acyl-CoA dehydrogenase
MGVWLIGMLLFGDQQRAIAQTATAFCKDRCTERVVRECVGRFPAELWASLGELGLLALAAPGSGTGVLDLVAAVEVLGAALCPGPLASTFFATQLLPTAEREAIASGRITAAVGSPPWFPWGPVAQVWLAIDGARAWRVRPVEMQSLDTLGGEPWARATVEREADLGDPTRALAIADVTRAAYLVGTGERLIDAAGEHARTRRQFGRTLGEFQAVAHPLASCALSLEAAAGLTRSAARQMDQEASAGIAASAVARRSANRAALRAAHVAGQVFGAFGMTAEGPVFPAARRIRQLASDPCDVSSGDRALWEALQPPSP